MKSKFLAGKKLEWLVFALFVVAYCVISAYHEPWFDEAQSWQIAKCASLREILFVIPHYEGHPPLWWLLLVIPAKLGVPFEIGLKTVGFLISAASAALVLFRSRLPRLLRLTLPFTYFFFYQYGVIVRPYGLMLFFLLLLGMRLSERNTRPWQNVLILGGLCMTGAYGILVAGGVSACILWELWREKGLQRLLTELLRDRRTASLLALLIWAILLIWEFLPAEDAYATHLLGETSLPVRLFCAFFTLLPNCFLTTSSWFSADQVSMHVLGIPTTQLIISAVLGLIILMGIVCVSSKRSLKFFLVPYVLYALFSAVIYFSTHHMGIVFALVLFWAEMTCRDKERLEIGRLAAAGIAKSQRDRTLLRSTGFFLAAACTVIPLYWTAAASVREVQDDYCFARSMAKFLQETGLSEDPRIFCMWDYGGSAYPEAEGNENYILTDMNGNAVSLNAYFDRNIVFNLNDGNDDEAYLRHRTFSYEESRTTANAWRSKGVPDVVIGYPALEAVYGSEISASDYTCVYKSEIDFIWKDKRSSVVLPVYVRSDLLDEYGLVAVDDLEIRVRYENVEITDEMREAFENGVPIEEILKPYLDAMFGEED